MRETFYIYKSGVSQYQLRMKEDHMVISTSSSKEGILASLTEIVKRYKTSTRLFEKLRDSELRENKETILRRSEEYKGLDEELQEGLDKTILEALKEVKVDSKIKLIGKETIKITPKKVEKEKPKQKVVLKKKKIGLITI